MKTAVVYFSLGGSTRSFARAEADARRADLFEVVPVKHYNPLTAFLKGCPAARQQKSVPLASPTPDLSGYDRVVLMAPVWAGFPAPPFNSIIELLPRGAAAEVLLVSAGGDSAASRDRVRQKLAEAGVSVTAQRDVRAMKR